jgi:two-component system, NarL family, sensor histidine kinase DegS
MKKIDSARTRKSILKNAHLWIIAVVTLFLTLFYPLWPWREWQFTQGVWGWFPWLSSLYSLALFERSHYLVGSLFLFPIIYATIVFKWRGALIIFLFSLIGLWQTIPSYSTYWRNPETGLANISILLLPALVMIAFNVELELRRKDKKIYQEREKERQIYMAKIIEAQEKERRRLAEELHDQNIQTLLAVASYAESIELLDDNIPDIKKKAALIKNQTRNTVDELRRISTDLRPGILDDMGLPAALKWLANRTAKEKHIQTRIKIDDFKKKLTPLLEVNVFRIVQEALRNIERHANADEVQINLEADTNSIKITIQDNGQGFVLPNKLGNLVTEGKLGLIGVEERVNFLGGKFEIRSKLEEGTSLLIEIPYSC